MATISLKAIGKTYPDGYQAVRAVDLEIEDGEFVVLVGPSGCGKSTTLRMIAGLEDVSAGEISIGGRVVNDVHPKDRDIAMVFQNYALYPHMTVYQNMAFALKLRGVSKPETDRRVRETARLLGLEELLERKPRALSGGQRQRVAVGRAIVREPRAFLFDEPLSNLDARLRVSTRAELKALHQRLKTTTVYVTHDQEEAMTLGERIVVMSKGLVQQVGRPLDVYRNPANRFVASFVGTPAMNFLDGSIEGGGGGVEFASKDGRARLGLAALRSAELGKYAGKAVVLGIRPQAFREAGPGDAPTLDAEVSVVEPLGDVVDVTCVLANQERLIARLPARDGLQPGQRIRLRPDMSAAHLFEPGEFGAAIV